MTVGKRDPDQEASYERGYELGKIVTLKDLSKKLRERAGVAFGSVHFSTGGLVDDKEAYLLRKKYHPELVRA